MFQLYKKRDFNAYVSDTITFFKENFKNYFANFIILTGALLLVLCLIFFFIFKDFFSSFLTNTANPNFMVNYMQENIGSFILLGSIGFVVALVFTCVTMSFPIAYLKLMDKTGKDNLTSSELFDQMKSMLGKIIIFAMLSVVIIFPLAMITFGLSMLLVVVIIGIPIIIILMPAFYIWVSQSFYAYLNEEIGFFDSLGRGWKILFSKKFWPITGNTIVMYIVVGILQSILPMIPYFFMIGSMLSSGDKVAKMAEMGGYMVTIYIISIVTSYIFSNILIVNQGLIYYSSLEQQTNTQALSEIESIGQDAE